MSDVVKWEQPPQFEQRGGRPSSVHGPIATALRSNPGKWALVQENQRTRITVTVIQSARISCYEPRGAFEASARIQEDGRFNIYARFVGAS